MEAYNSKAIDTYNTDSLIACKVLQLKNNEEQRDQANNIYWIIFDYLNSFAQELSLNQHWNIIRKFVQPKNLSNQLINQLKNQPQLFLLLLNQMQFQAKDTISITSLKMTKEVIVI